MEKIIRKKKYLPLYEKWLEKGTMPFDKKMDVSGLCDYFGEDSLFQLIIPTNEDFNQLESEGKSTYLWASDLLWNDDREFYTFNPLRQNIVLFMAAMNNEL